MKCIIIDKHLSKTIILEYDEKETETKKKDIYDLVVFDNSIGLSCCVLMYVDIIVYAKDFWEKHEEWFVETSSASRRLL